MSVPYTAIARYPYQPDAANASDDLPLKTNQVLTVSEIVDTDWLFGSYIDETGNTLSGYFPKSFVEPYTEPQETPIHHTPAVSAEPIVQHVSEPESEPESLAEEKEEEEEEVKQPIVDASEPNLSTLDPKLQDIESNIIHEPENFKNKLQSFNVSSTPLMPMGKPIEEKFVKKAFSAADHRTSYIPPSLGTSKPAKKEEKKPDVIFGEIISESSKAEEVEAPRMTLKERMQLLQKQQEEEQQAIEAALKRKEERKKAKQLQHNHTVSEIDDQVNIQEPGLLTEAKTVSDEIDSDSDEEADITTATATAPPSTLNQSQAKNIVAALEQDGSENDEEENEENEEHDDEDDDEDDEDDDEEETEEDEEELRKRRLAVRMAKLSGGMGMMGMMGMMNSPIPTKTTKKTKKTKKDKKIEEDELSNVPQAVPILPMGPGAVPPIMGMPHPGTITSVPTETADTLNEENIEEEEETTEPHTEGLLSSPIQPVPPILEQAKRFDTTDEEDDDDDFHDTFESATASPKKLATTPAMEQHPYRQHFGTPTTHAPSVPVPAIPSAQATAIAPPVPTSMPSATPPVPSVSAPITTAPTTTRTSNEYTRTPISAPPIPGVPSTMPQTIPPARSAVAPPAPTTTIPLATAFTGSAPPPIPGSVPAVPSVTRKTSIPPPPPHAQPPVLSAASVSDSISRHSSIRTASHAAITSPTASTFGGSAPPIPGAIQRHTTLGHAPPPPPPPTESVPATPQNSSVTGISRQLTNASAETTSSISQEVQSTPTTSTSELWWTTQSLPPQLTKTDVYFEVVVTDIPKRGGNAIKYLIYYVLDARLTSITMQLAYDVTEPERLLFFHEEKEKNKSDRNKLIDEYTKYGPTAYNIAVKSLNKSYNGEYINFIFSNLPKEVLRPIANKTFGDVVYRNTNGDAKSFDDIRPGDILVLVTSVFEGQSGIKEVGFGKPHVALVTSFDSEKNRIKVVEQTDGLIRQGKYKLKNLKSGKLRVFRIVGRDYVGW